MEINLGLAIGAVGAHGGIAGLADHGFDGNSDFASDGGSGDSGSSDGGWDISDIFDFDSLDYSMLPEKSLISKAWAMVCGLCVILSAKMARAAEATQERMGGWLFAFYVGPTINFGPVFFTGGACLGQFGCLAIGGGINFGPIGFGILIPMWIWW